MKTTVEYMHLHGAKGRYELKDENIWQELGIQCL